MTAHRAAWVCHWQSTCQAKSYSVDVGVQQGILCKSTELSTLFSGKTAILRQSRGLKLPSARGWESGGSWRVHTLSILILNRKKNAIADACFFVDNLGLAKGIAAFNSRSGR